MSRHGIPIIVPSFRSSRAPSTSSASPTTSTSTSSASSTSSTSSYPVPSTPKSVEEADEVEVGEVILMPETEEEIEFRKRKYPTIFLGRTKNTGVGESENKLIIEQLHRLVEHIEDQIRSSNLAEDRKKHGFRLSSIKKGIDLIADWPEKICSGRQARQIKGIGKGISDRIDEIITSGTLSELSVNLSVNLGADSTRKIAELTTVSGIGVVKARELLQKFKLNGVEDLIKRWKAGEIKVGKHELTHHIEVGLRWYHDIKQKIPREELDAFFSLLVKTCKKIDKKLKVQICGSYRRGKSQSNDVDILLTHPDLITQPDVTVCPVKYLPSLLEILVDDDIIVDSMTKEGTTKYMGVARLSEKHTGRRIDIRFVPYESWATGLYYLTGSGPFNKIFRGVALQRGYTLNEYGIYKLDENGERGENIPVYSEEQIFDVVGVEYLTPEQRDL